MKLLTKITLLITGAGILVSLVFSLIVFYEMSEQIYRQLDDALKATLHNVFTMVIQNDARVLEPGFEQSSPLPIISFDNRHYWIKVRRAGKLIYSSPLAKIVDLPLTSTKKKFTVSINIPKEKIDLHQDRFNEVTFRVRSVEVTADAAPPGYHIYVALPMEKLNEEIVEVILFISLGLSFSTLLLILISYFLAGRILSPISRITNLAREIDENDLAVRIPLNPSQDELYDLAFALNQMLDRLQYSFTRQKQFLADAAHELNTPMTSVRIFMEQSLLNQKLPADFHKDLQRQQQVMLRIKRLLQDLMTLSWLELGRKIRPETFDLTATTASVIEDFKPLIEEKNIQWSSSLPKTLNYFGDPGQFHRALVNIIDNAIKYNLPSGQLVIRLKKLTNTIQLNVTNSGTPIPKEDLEHVFDQFYRVEKSRSQEFGGCGLGLTIVREIIGLHGGRVSLENEPPDKIVLTITLPLDKTDRSINAILET